MALGSGGSLLCLHLVSVWMGLSPRTLLLCLSFLTWSRGLLGLRRLGWRINKCWGQVSRVCGTWQNGVWCGVPRSGQPLRWVTGA